MLTRKIPFLKTLIIPFVICLLFFIAYSTLCIVRHNNYQSFGYDMGINDQVVWKYSTLQAPISTIDPLPNQSKLATHVELIYALISPFYWIWSSRKMLILVRTAWFCLSGVAVYLLARKKKVNQPVSLSLTIGYLAFYGVQFAIWTDVHSASFAAAFLMWFIYFAELKKKMTSTIFFLLAITSKENIALLTFLTSFVFFVKQKSKFFLFLMTASILYLLFIFFIFFPHIMHVNYLYQNSGGLLSNLNPLSLIDASDNRQAIWYSLLSYGFLPLLSPLYLLPALGDIVTYFMFGSDLSGAQGIFGHYRITLTPFLIWASIITIARYKRLNSKYFALYLLFFTLLTQYLLHLPLSYLTKEWFWTKPTAVESINRLIIGSLPPTASVVSQNNITPHLSHRNQIYTLYPEKKKFKDNSPCGKEECDWFRWYGSPQYLIADTSPEWDSRHLLTNREPYIQGLKNIEKAGIVKKYKQMGNTILYKINKNPESI